MVRPVFNDTFIASSMLHLVLNDTAICSSMVGLVFNATVMGSSTVRQSCAYFLSMARLLCICVSSKNCDDGVYVASILHRCCVYTKPTNASTVHLRKSVTNESKLLALIDAPAGEKDYNECCVYRCVLGPIPL